MTDRIPTWQQRIDTLDHSKGTSNKMIQDCMLAEINALRKALREARLDRDEWKTCAMRYRTSLMEKVNDKTHHNPNR